ncbi:MAG: hypothetical protein ACI8W8_003101 [Rhodothermales bacterium]|jgi:hypothetical protein
MTAKKKSWAWIPTIVYLSFVLGLLSLARIATQSPPALVYSDYYERGLQHDQVMAAEASAQTLGLQPAITQTANGLRIDLAKPVTDAVLHLQRPSDANADEERPLSFVANSANTGPLAPGLWRYTFTCTASDTPCATRGILHIQ